MLAFAIAAPTAAVPLTVAPGESPLPPHATNALVASTIDPNCSVRSVAPFRSFIAYLQRKSFTIDRHQRPSVAYTLQTVSADAM
jgi:hypothetical protein